MPHVELPSYWLHPEGWFPATVVKIEDVDGKYGPQIRWHFETPEKQEDDDGKPICGEDGQQLQGRLSDFTGIKASSGSTKPSKLGKLLLGLGCKLPSTQEEAEAMNDDWFLKLYGKKVMIKVVQQTMDDGRVFANIFEYKPVGAVGTGRPAGKTATVHTPPEGCPDPTYNHNAKPGDDDYDPFHAESGCPMLKAAA